MKGAFASLASRRAISVLPTPVGPIMRMFFGVISVRSGSATCERRQRLRSAIATARFASSCPTMYLSSSWTISCGVIIDGAWEEPVASGVAFTSCLAPRTSHLAPVSQRLDHVVLVGVDADLARDRERPFHHFRGIERGIVEERHRRGLRVAAAAADGKEPAFGLEHVAR